MDTKIIDKYLTDVNKALAKAKRPVKISNVLTSDAYFARMIQKALIDYDFGMALWMCNIAFLSSSERVKEATQWFTQGDSSEVLDQLFYVMDYDKQDMEKIYSVFDSKEQGQNLKLAMASSLETCKTKIHTLFISDYVDSVFKKAINDSKKADEIIEYYNEVNIDVAPAPYFMVLLKSAIEGLSFADARKNSYGFDVSRLEDVFDNIKDILGVSGMDEVLSLI